MRKNTIELAFCIDDGYATHLATLIISIQRNLSTNYKLNCHVFGRLNPNIAQSLMTLECESTRVYLHSGLPDYSNLQISERYKDRLNEVTYYRFSVPEILSDCERVIFVDADMIAQGDISPLWEINLHGGIVGVVTDQLLGVDRAGQLARGITTGQYFNAGMMVIDIAAWNKFSVSKNSIDLLIKTQGMEHNDQDALNVVLEEKCYYIDSIWNAQSLLLTPDLIQSARLIHFCGQEKPWHVTSEHPLTSVYLNYKKQTPFSDVPLELFLDPTDINLIANLKNELPNGGSLAIWGRGQRGRRICYQINVNMPEYTIRYLVDKNITSPYLGIPVFNGLTECKTIDALVIASVPYRHEIISLLPLDTIANIKII